MGQKELTSPVQSLGNRYMDWAVSGIHRPILSSLHLFSHRYSLSRVDFTILQYLIPNENTRRLDKPNTTQLFLFLRPTKT